MASNDGTCCVAAMAGDGFAGDASLSGDHSSNDKRGCDVVQGCRVDCEEDDREEVDGKEVDREEDDGKEVDGKEDDGKEVDGKEDGDKEDDREEDDREEDDREEVDGEVDADSNSSPQDASSPSNSGSSNS